MRVLSLFDGISCGNLALRALGITPELYYASEIERNAIRVTQVRFPRTIQLGDVRQVDAGKLPKIDLLLAGSPCQDLSLLNTKQDGLHGVKSGLFYEFIRLFDSIKPRYFFLENVIMSQANRDAITRLVGVEPIQLCSGLYSAQTRNRLYWTNVPRTAHRFHLGLCANDIVDHATIEARTKTYKLHRPITKLQKDIGETRMGNRRVYTLADKIGALTVGTPYRHVSPGSCSLEYTEHVSVFRLTPLEHERLQTIPDNYTRCIPDNARYAALGNCWTVDVVTDLLKGLDK